MPYFGAHLSSAGGPHHALEAARALGMDAVQLFTFSPRIWPAKPVNPPKGPASWHVAPLPGGTVDKFRAVRAQTHARVAAAHASYLINLGASDDALRERSMVALKAELERGEQLGLEFVVVHPGSATDGDVEAGLARIARAIDAVLAQVAISPTRLLLETTAGQGNSLGHRFEHLATIIEHMRLGDRVGVCLDTCHVFAAGYALSPRSAYLRTFRELDRTVGLDRVQLFHVNDSAKPLGSRVDRHAHLGKGQIGLDAFGFLVNDRRFRRHPMIMETPKGEIDGQPWDLVNLSVLRDLLESGRS